MKVNYTLALKNKQRALNKLVTKKPDEHTLEKIKKDCLTSGIKLTTALKEFEQSSLLRAKYAIKAGRQGIHESTWYKVAKKKYGTNIKKLAQTMSERSLYFQMGQVVKKTEVSAFNKVKAIDGIHKTKNGPVYLINKFVNQAGGTQDYAINDVKEQLEQARGISGAAVIAVCDGGYAKSKVQELKRLFQQGNVFVCSSENYEKTLALANKKLKLSKKKK